MECWGKKKKSIYLTLRGLDERGNLREKRSGGLSIGIVSNAGYMLPIVIPTWIPR